MTVRGRIATLPKKVTSQSDNIIKMYYEQGLKQKEIKDKLGLDSISVVAEVLRRDMVTRVEKFKKLDKNAKDYSNKVITIIKFLKNSRKLDYSSIATILEIPRDEVFRYISDETSGLRNSLSVTERLDRNAEMVRLSQEEGLSVTEIGKRMGLSKQMVSRIFTDMNYKPIRGTRKVQITQKNLPELLKFMKDDCNAKLGELHDELRSVKSAFASNRQYNNKVIIELRCKLIKALRNSNVPNEKELANQLKFINVIYKQILETTTEGARPPYFKLIEETLGDNK